MTRGAALAHLNDVRQNKACAYDRVCLGRKIKINLSLAHKPGFGFVEGKKNKV